MTFASLYGGFARHPVRTAETLASESRALRQGFLALLVPLVGYVIVYCGLAQSGAYPSRFSPWLAIEAEHYYRYNIFLLPIGILAAWLLASSVVQILGRAVGARATFEQTAAALGFAISISSWTLLPHDLAVGILGGFHVIDGRAHELAMNAPTTGRTLLWTFAALYMVAFPVYFSAAMRGVHRVRRGAGALLGVVGFVVYQLVFVLFNR